MKQRNIALCIVLTLVTCGIYGIYWYISLTDEVNNLRGQQDVAGGMAFLFALITCGIYSIYWCYRMGQKMDEIKVQRGGVAANSPLIYLLLSIFGLSIVAYALIQNDLNNYLPGDAGTM